MKLFYSPDYVLTEYVFDTTRKARWVAESFQAQSVAGIEFVAPEPVSEAALCELHDPAYVEAVRTGEPRALAELERQLWVGSSASKVASVEVTDLDPSAAPAAFRTG